MDSDIFLLSISGHDKPGLTSSLTAVLAAYDANVLDIGQANIHDTLSLGILFQIKSGKKSAAVLKDILFKSYELGIKVGDIMGMIHTGSRDVGFYVDGRWMDKAKEAYPKNMKHPENKTYA